MLKRGDIVTYDGTTHVVTRITHEVASFVIACRPKMLLPLIGWHPLAKVPTCLMCIAAGT